MKIRTGFVSNSSTASFVVRFRHAFRNEGPGPMVATEEDIKKLIAYGFVLSGCCNANPFDVDKFENRDVNKKYVTSLRYDVTVNEDIVVSFLTKNNIPFKAAVHYENYFYQFLRGDDFYTRVLNLGQIVAMYGLDYFDDDSESLEEPIKKVPIEYCKNDYKEGDKPYCDKDQEGLKVTAEEIIELMNTQWGE